MEKLIAMAILCIDSGCHILLPGPPPVSDHITTDRAACEAQAVELLRDGIERLGDNFTQRPLAICADATKEWLDM